MSLLLTLNSLQVSLWTDTPGVSTEISQTVHINILWHLLALAITPIARVSSVAVLTSPHPPPPCQEDSWLSSMPRGSLGCLVAE